MPCYSDEKSLLGLIDAELAEAGLSIDRETRDYLMTRLGADQALSRSEVVKLALYAQGSERIEPEDIEAIVGDAAETALDNFAYAVSGGDAKAALSELQRLGGRGHRQVGRRCRRSGGISRSCIASPRRQARATAWSRPRSRSSRGRISSASRCSSRIASAGARAGLRDALPLIQEAVRRSRRSPDLEGAFAERLVLTLTSRI